MSDIGPQGGIATVPDDAPVEGGNPGQPSRPDTSSSSSVAPLDSPTFPGNPNRAK
jgi:hypothetical protein